MAFIAAFHVADAAESTIFGDDSRITYVGRVLAHDRAVSFDWSGVTAIISFEGTCLSLDADDTDTDSYNVWIDREPSAEADKVVSLTSGCKLVSSLKKGRHTVVIQKRTEGEQGLCTIKSLSTDGRFVKARGLKARRVEFVGDSYTCGYGTESKSAKEGFKPQTENCNKAYAAIIGRFFDADVQLVCHSGRGVARNYAGLNPDQTVTNKYLQTFDCAEGPAWNDGHFAPALVVVYLGTNDFSCGEHPTLENWCAEYRRILTQIRANYKSAPILCVASKADPLLAEYVKTAVEQSGLENIHWAAIQADAHNDSTELGASCHPNYEGQRKVATLMIPYISTITGWAMSHKVVE